MLVMRITLRQGGVAVTHVHVLLMIRIVVKASALGISWVEVASVAAVIDRGRHSSKTLMMLAGSESRLTALEIGNVIRRYLPGRQELLWLLVLVLVLVALAYLCRRGASIVAIASLPTRSDRRRAVQPGPLRTGGTCRLCGVERSAKFL